MAIPFIPLPYPYDGLEPQLEAEILTLHHNKHLKKYVDSVNSILEMYPEFQDYTVEELILLNLTLPEEIQEAMWNNAGGVYNHNFYFGIMGKCDKKQPEGNLLKAIEEAFGSFEEFKKAFSKKAAGVFGSGYTWLVTDEAGKLSIISTPNQDTVLPLPVTPILLIDVWEHAYYLQYKNVRADYIKNWFDIICWDVVEKKYQF